MAAMPFFCTGTMLFQSNLTRVLPVIIWKCASWMNEWMNEKFIILRDAFKNDNSILDLGKSAQQKVIAWKISYVYVKFQIE